MQQPSDHIDPRRPRGLPLHVDAMQALQRVLVGPGTNARNRSVGN
jgi:hypothetical protein